MLNIPNTNLWLGTAQDLRQIPQCLKQGITAIVDLAIEEPVPTIPRITNYCRFLVTDDGENDPANLRAAISVSTVFLQGGHATVICCNAGLSRSPSIAAAVLSRISDQSPVACLERIATVKHIDVNPALWNQMVTICELMNDVT